MYNFRGMGSTHLPALIVPHLMSACPGLVFRNWRVVAAMDRLGAWRWWWWLDNSQRHSGTPKMTISAHFWAWWWRLDDSQNPNNECEGLFLGWWQPEDRTLKMTIRAYFRDWGHGSGGQTTFRTPKMSPNAHFQD